VAAALQLAIVFTVSRRARRWTAAGLAGALPLLLAGAGRRIGDIIWSIRPGQFLLGGAADPTLLTRIFIWQQSVQLLIKNPLTGIGLGMMPRQGIVYAGWYHVTNAHNLLLNLWVEGGTPAALALASLFGGVFWTAARAYRLADNLDNRRMMLTFVVSIAGYVLLSQAHSFLALDHGISQTLVVWMVLALVVAVARQPAEGEAPV
jgi:O-antigen ligase